MKNHIHISIYLSSEAKKIYDLKKNKSEFINNLILENSKKIKDDLDLIKLNKKVDYSILQNSAILEFLEKSPEFENFKVLL
jgi:hypothetical protein